MPTHDIPTLTAEPREQLGTRSTQRLRERGLLPAVVYGHKQDPAHVSVDAGRFTELLHDETHLLQLAVGNKQEHCLIKDVQWDHLGDHIIHADLARVDLAEEVEVEVEVHLAGDAVGLKEAGTYLEHTTSAVTIKCRAGNIPDHLTADISELQVNASFTAADLTLPDGVTLVSDPEAILAAVHVTKVVEETEEGAEPASDEPEVIKKEKPDETDE